MIFSGVKAYIYAGIATLIVSSIAAAVVFKLKYDVAKVREEVAIQQRDTVMDMNKQILAAAKKDSELRVILYNDLQMARIDANETKRKLASHDLSELAKAKPGLITRLARRATDRVLRDIESAANGADIPLSGSPSGGPDKVAAAPADSRGH